jgi:DNA integrity scanning protein DisA with diadenylate cyclase activity
MVKPHDVPNLDSALEKSFAEMKIGEENFSNEEVNEDAPEESVSKIAYGQKYTSENQSGKIIVQPIRATKKVIEDGVEIEDLVVDESLKDVGISKPETIVVESPTSTIGDDFAVEW